jgi:hypothetical protein
MTALLDTVVLSIRVGHPGAHPLIYRTALELPDRAPAGPVAAGDSYVAGHRGLTTQAIGVPPLDPAGSADVPAERRSTPFLDLPGIL